MEKKELLKIYGTTDYKSLTDAERTVFRNVISTLEEQGAWAP